MRSFFSLMICLCLPLQGGVATALISSATLATGVAVDPRSAGEQIDDSTLLFRTTQILNRDPQLHQQARVIPTVWQGRVLLTGEAPTAYLRSRAQQLVRGVSGVGEVWNEIRSGTPITSDQIARDIWLGSQIRARVLFSDRARLSDMKVVAENGEVFLLGRVTPEEGRRVTRLVSHVGGVRHVTTAWIPVR
ncbi:divisome-associated lipoprotein YraP [Salmonella enterica]|nr:divisome-associated lipoprotein YraP [Salmonella enterica]